MAQVKQDTGQGDSILKMLFVWLVLVGLVLSMLGLKHSCCCCCLWVDSQKAATQDTAQPQEGSEDAAVTRDNHRVRILFERCLIACALYEEYWTKVRISSVCVQLDVYHLVTRGSD